MSTDTKWGFDIGHVANNCELHEMLVGQQVTTMIDQYAQQDSNLQPSIPKTCGIEAD